MSFAPRLPKCQKNRKSPILNMKWPPIQLSASNITGSSEPATGARRDPRRSMNSDSHSRRFPEKAVS